MATQNAIDTNKPIGVDDGGTGAATLTDHGVLVGSGTVAITALTVGTAGQLLVGSTGADPAFDDIAEADFTFGGAASGSDRTLTVSNTSNTASSDAKVDIQVGGTSAGDAFTQYAVSSGGTFSMGVDNDDSDSFKISASSALGTTDVIEITSAGEMTKPLQPAFLAYLASSDLNVTGDGTTYTFGAGTASTEVYDQGSDYVTTGTFTAPVTGRYSLRGGMRVGGLLSTHTSGFIAIATSNGNYANFLADWGNAYIASGTALSYCMAIEGDMDASDTATFFVQVANGTKVVDQITNGRNCFFAGHLIC